VKLKNLVTGGHIEKRFRSGETVEEVVLDKREMEYLYSDGSGAVFMDTETYDQATIATDILGNALEYIKPNTSVTGLVHSGNVVSIDMPSVVDLEITETTPAIKGATATNQFKEATCETGLQTRVPPFIKIGEVVRINTETGEYLSRVSES
jgi:elongation factor P